MTPPFYPPPEQPVLKVPVDITDINTEVHRLLKFYNDYYGKPRKIMLSTVDFRYAFYTEGIICEPREGVPAGNIWVLG